MVATRLRLGDLHLFFRSDHSRKKRCTPSDPCAPTLGILAFEAARTISHLISIHNSLSQPQIHALRNVVFRSRGIQYMNSSDESFLLNLAFSEKMDELDRAAASVSRLASRCRRQDLQHFDRTYADLKTGNVDLAKLAFSAKEMPREMAKMEKLAAATAELYSVMGELTELETMVRKLQQQVMMFATAEKEAEAEMVEQKVVWHRDHVQRLREACLWSLPFDAVALPMARFICNIFARICVVFAPYVSDLPQVICDGNMVFVSPKQLQIFNPFRSGPLERTAPKEPPPITASGPLFHKPRNGVQASLRSRDAEARRKAAAARKRPGVMKCADATTVGCSALAMRYSDIIILADKILNSVAPVEQEMRQELYRQLPASLQSMVNAKIKKCLECGDSWLSDELMAEGWREAMGQILGWLAPLAYNMMKWQSERNLEQMRFDSQSSVLLLETLYFSDKEKTEAAIVEVLAGLSFICRWEGRRPAGPKP
ncbi:hypothetical protein ACLOJK_030081 [Asimina triloba]